MSSVAYTQRGALSSLPGASYVHQSHELRIYVYVSVCFCDNCHNHSAAAATAAAAPQQHRHYSVLSTVSLRRSQLNFLMHFVRVYYFNYKLAKLKCLLMQIAAVCSSAFHWIFLCTLYISFSLLPYKINY